ncbi:MAG: RNA methyltransferase [Syntrophorhabdaceae bacterium]|nr:RNA methyltransferase [Syntrophorhabdaceae bacterium]
MIHYPVYNKNREIVATSINSLELHDIARTCMTFGIKMCYIVTPLPKQRMIMERLIEHWRHGYGADYNPIRSAALNTIAMRESLEGLLDEIKKETDMMVIGTSSKLRPHKAIGYDEVKTLVHKKRKHILLLFGTGWGLTDETVEICDRMLEPIRGTYEYNHLSLRVAIGIILDRLFGERGGKNERGN